GSRTGGLYRRGATARQPPAISHRSVEGTLWEEPRDAGQYRAGRLGSPDAANAADALCGSLEGGPRRCAGGARFAFRAGVGDPGDRSGRVALALSIRQPDRQGEMDGRSMSAGALHPNPAAVRLNDAPGDEESEARAAMLRACGLRVPVEQVRYFLRFDPR